jgi:nucleotide-binding universal stress UspA family protein
MNVREILVPLDQKEISEAGLRWASGAAYRSGAKLRLMSVVGARVEEGEKANADALEYLKNHRTNLSADRIEASCDVSQGDPATRILEESTRADLVVMTSGTTRWGVSAVLDRVLQSMTTPLVTVRGDKGTLKGATNLDSLLIPLSETDYSSSILPAATEIAIGLTAKVILFQNVDVDVSAPGSHGVPPVVPQSLKLQLESAERHVDECALAVRDAGLKVETIVSSGDHVREITQAAYRSGAGLIAMATRGRDRLESRISGSVANAVIDTSTTPCLIVRVIAGPGARDLIDGASNGDREMTAGSHLPADTRD